MYDFFFQRRKKMRCDFGPVKLVNGEQLCAFDSFRTL